MSLTPLLVCPRSDTTVLWCADRDDDAMRTSMNALARRGFTLGLYSPTSVDAARRARRPNVFSTFCDHGPRFGFVNGRCDPINIRPLTERTAL
jgi:hypothetical protein